MIIPILIPFNTYILYLYYYYYYDSTLSSSSSISSVLTKSETYVLQCDTIARIIHTIIRWRSVCHMFGTMNDGLWYAMKRVIQKARYVNETFMIKVVDGGKSSSLKEPSSLIDGTTEL
jgi:hypothetical protein